MSGPMPYHTKRTNFKATTAVAVHLGCLDKKYGFGRLERRVMEQTFKCLRAVSAEKLLDAEFWVLKNSTYYFGTGHVDGEFITDYPDRMFDEKSVYPITTMIGTTSAEVRKSKYIIDPKYCKPELLRSLCEHIGYEIFDSPQKFSEDCYSYYKNGTDAQYLTDDYEFYSGAMNFANAHISDKTKVYLYNYEYTGAGAAFGKYLPGVASPYHSEDLIYVLGNHRAVMAPKDYIIEKIYSGMFANFVNFGDPSPSEEQKWKPYSKENREYFLINFDVNFTMPGMREKYYTRALDFWINSGYKKHHKELWAPSLDTHVVNDLVNSVIAYLTNDTKLFVGEKEIGQELKVYEEREQFLVELKKMNLNLNVRAGDFELESKKEDGGINILLTIFSGTLLVGILYLTVTHFCLHRRSRDGYQLLK